MPDFSREQAIFVTGSLLVLAVIALAAALSYTASAMIPLVMAFMISYMVGPLVDTLQVRLNLPRAAAILITLAALGVGASLVTSFMWSSLTSVGSDTAAFETRVGELLHESIDVIEARAPGLLPRGLLDAEEIRFDDDSVRPLIEAAQSATGGLLQAVSQLMSNAVLVTVLALYLVAGRGPSDVQQGLIGEIEAQVRSYLGTKFLTSAVTGFLTWVSLSLLGIDLAVVFGFMAFLLNFIPTFGSVIATLLPLPLAVLEFSTTPWRIVAAIVLPGTCQFIIGNLVEPKIMGDALHLHPVTILVNLIFWGILWGPVGMLLATPMAAVIRMVCERFDTTRPIAWLLAGQLDQLQGRIH